QDEMASEVSRPIFRRETSKDPLAPATSGAGWPPHEPIDQSKRHSDRGTENRGTEQEQADTTHEGSRENPPARRVCLHPLGKPRFHGVGSSEPQPSAAS